MKNVSEIKEKMLKGDLETASKMVGITPANGSKALSREGSKYHESIIKALNRVFENREKLILESSEA